GPRSLTPAAGEGRAEAPVRAGEPADAGPGQGEELRVQGADRRLALLVARKEQRREASALPPQDEGVRRVAPGELEEEPGRRNVRAAGAVAELRHERKEHVEDAAVRRVEARDRLDEGNRLRRRAEREARHV